MVLTDDYNLDQKTIRKIGLQPCDKDFSAQIAPNARVFKYPSLDNVFVMESDLYGNRIPKEACYLAFYGAHGLMGKYMSIEKLKRLSARDISKIVERNKKG